MAQRRSRSLVDLADERDGAAVHRHQYDNLGMVAGDSNVISEVRRRRATAGKTLTRSTPSNKKC